MTKMSQPVVLSKAPIMGLVCVAKLEANPKPSEPPGSINERSSPNMSSVIRAIKNPPAITTTAPISVSTFSSCLHLTIHETVSLKNSKSIFSPVVSVFAFQT